MVNDFAAKPLNSGKADIDIAPMMQKMQVIGIILYNPPSSEALIVPTLMQDRSHAHKQQCLVYNMREGMR